jgi:uncharacterized protein
MTSRSGSWSTSASTTSSSARPERFSSLERTVAIGRLRFHGALNDLLPASVRDSTIRRTVHGSPAVKDVIESLGVPHVEVGAIAVDGVRVSLGHRVRDGELIDVYPPGDPDREPRPTRFVVDGHLGRLAAYLRMLGFDTLWAADAEDAELAETARRDDRILLSRDRGLLKRSVVRRGYVVRSDRPHRQLREVVDRYRLAPESRPFGRCLRCNGILQSVDPSIAVPLVPPRVALEQTEFRRCAACGTLYWRGSHHTRMVRLIATLLPEVRSATTEPTLVEPEQSAG